MLVLRMTLSEPKPVAHHESLMTHCRIGRLCGKSLDHKQDPCAAPYPSVPAVLADIIPVPMDLVPSS